MHSGKQEFCDPEGLRQNDHGIREYNDRALAFRKTEAMRAGRLEVEAVTKRSPEALRKAIAGTVKMVMQEPRRRNGNKNDRRHS
ncbi:MAG: hypothetical protein GX939_05905 [Clostridiaceae bacterium]|nr:hypothetical protein [Clostridiaceae bacterium]